MKDEQSKENIENINNNTMLAPLLSKTERGAARSMNGLFQQMSFPHCAQIFGC